MDYGSQVQNIQSSWKAKAVVEMGDEDDSEIPMASQALEQEQ